MSLTAAQLVAHRGYARAYPENTLPALQAALAAGAQFVEFDVHLSADQVPVLLHDESLQRTTGTPGTVSSTLLSRLRELDAGEPDRFGTVFRGTRIPTLAEAAALLEAWPAATVFVDVKDASLVHFGAARTMARILEALGNVRDRSVITCGVANALIEARQLGVAQVAWVVPGLGATERGVAGTLAPQYLFVDARLVPDRRGALWPGPWRWIVYDVEDVEHARAVLRLGADLVETKSFVELHAAASEDPHAA